MTELTRSQAFHYYQCCGLSYDDIDEKALGYLLCALDEQIARYRKERMGIGAEDKPCKWRFVLSQAVKPQLSPAGSLIQCQINAKCENRSVSEAISFHANRGISFAKDSTAEEVQPILLAFVEFCDWLEKKKYVEGLGTESEEEQDDFEE